MSTNTLPLSQVVPVSSLIPDEDNARAHPTRSIEALKESLSRFGQQKPIVVDRENRVRAGNGTLLAAIALGWGTISVVVSDLSPEELRAYALADNRTAELSEWDRDALLATIDELRERDAELPAAVGFSAEDIEKVRERVQASEQGSFEPTLEPVAAADDVTAADVEKAQGKVEERFTGNPDGYVAVACPHCGETFNLEKEALRAELKA